jgi:hypothetical protein
MPDYCHFDCIDLVYAAARPMTLRFVEVVFPGSVRSRRRTCCLPFAATDGEGASLVGG